VKRNFFSHVRRQYYSYVWLTELGMPYYVGKGFGNRAYIPHSHQAIPPVDRNRILIFPMKNESEALESEIELIRLFGRRDHGTGSLMNQTDGGRGLKNPSMEVRLRLVIGRTNSLIQSEAIANAQ
jgi:hypothetical protein